MRKSKTTKAKAKKAKAKKVRPRRNMPPIHPSIKARLGYDVEDTDADVLLDWKDRTSRICKPCWELKYCPYGPLVEQSPLLPPERAGVVDHNNYKKRALETGFLGGKSEVSAAAKRELGKVLADPDLLLQRAINSVEQEVRIERCLTSEDPVGAFLRNDLPPIEIYRVPYEVVSNGPASIANVPSKYRKRVRDAVKADKARLKSAIKTGIHDQTNPIDPIRKAWFEKELSEFREEDYPESIPPIFSEASCSIFGHICPVFFSAEAITETAEARRRGRYISFKTKIRVVRRDNYTCQHCTKHLQDNEVEFDHIIPVAKGGSSEEHNIRLTCFECNRDKSDDVEI